MADQDWDIDERLKPTLKIICTTEVPKFLIELFCKATKIIAKVAPPKPVKVIFARNRFRIEISNEHYGTYTENLIIYDVTKIEGVTDPKMALAIFLEELVHAYLDISDEIGHRLKSLNYILKLKLIAGLENTFCINVFNPKLNDNQGRSQ